MGCMNRWIHRKVAHAYSLINLPLCFLFTFHMCVSMSACIMGTGAHISTYMVRSILGLPPSPQASHPPACVLVLMLAQQWAIFPQGQLPRPPPPLCLTIVREAFCFIISQRCSFIVSRRTLTLFMHLYSFSKRQPLLCVIVYLILSW